MANVQISQLPAASPIDGTELVPIVQNGLTVRSTTGAIASAPNQTQTFLTVNQEPTLPNSRALSASSGLTLTDGGSLGSMVVGMNGAADSLNNSGNGFQVKTGLGTVTPRNLLTSGSGIAVTDGNGQDGNPTFQLTGLALSIANISGAGIVASTGTGVFTPRILTGTANQINVSDGTGASADPVISIANNPILPGTAAVTLPSGTTTDRPTGANGNIRFNTETSTYEGYASGSWRDFSLAGGVTSFSAGSTGFTPAGTTSGAITLGGILNVSNGGTGAGTLTGYTKGNGTAPFTAASTIPASDLSGLILNSQLDNNTTTINGVTIALGSSGTITASASNPLTIGTGLSGTSYDGSSAVTIAIDSTVSTASNAQTLTNKSISGSTNTLTNIPNSALTNSLVTIGSTPISLGSTALTLAGVTSLTLTQDPVSSLQAVTKQYVDALASGINFHTACQLATVATLPSSTYNNGASGVGATLTGTANGALSVDGTLVVVGNRVLVKNQVSGLQNGVYTVTQVGDGSTPFILTRATDYDSSGSGPNEINAGDLMLILGGATIANTSWVQQTELPITVGVTALVFIQFAAPITYSAGTGLTLAGTQFSITNTGVTAASYGAASKTLTASVNAQGQLTLLADTNIAIDASQITSGTISSALISGSYTGITGVDTLTAGIWNASTIQVAYGGTGITSFGAGIATFLGTPSSANLASTVTDETGSGSLVFATSPTLVTPVLGTPASAILTNATGLPLTTGVTGLLPIANGGTNSSAVATAGGAGYGTGTAHAYTAAGTAGQVLTSTGATAPTWSGISGGTF